MLCAVFIVCSKLHDSIFVAFALPDDQTRTFLSEGNHVNEQCSISHWLCVC